MGRPSVADEPVSPDAIARVALDLLAQEGPDALSFRRVAGALGVSHTTVHRHCGSFEGLLDTCAEHLAAGLPDVDPGLPWTEATEQRFTALYEVLVTNVALVVLQRGRPWLGPEMMRRFSEPAVTASLAAGMSFADTVAAHRELYMFTIGCVLTVTSYDMKAGRRSLAALDPDDCPTLTTHINEYVTDASNRGTFIRGLRHLISALDPT